MELQQRYSYIAYRSDNPLENFKFLVDKKGLFISAKFEKPSRVTSELFYQCLQRLERENAPISEKRKFRRFYVEPLKIIVDTPLGVGYMVDLSLKGMKVKLKRTYNVEPDILKETFSVSCCIPNFDDEYILDTRLV